MIKELSKLTWKRKSELVLAHHLVQSEPEEFQQVGQYF